MLRGPYDLNAIRLAICKASACLLYYPFQCLQLFLFFVVSRCFCSLFWFFCFLNLFHLISSPIISSCLQCLDFIYLILFVSHKYLCFEFTLRSASRVLSLWTLLNWEHVNLEFIPSPIITSPLFSRFTFLRYLDTFHWDYFSFRKMSLKNSVRLVYCNEFL